MDFLTLKPRAVIAQSVKHRWLNTEYSFHRKQMVMRKGFKGGLSLNMNDLTGFIVEGFDPTLTM